MSSGMNLGEFFEDECWNFRLRALLKLELVKKTAMRRRFDVSCYVTCFDKCMLINVLFSRLTFENHSDVATLGMRLPGHLAAASSADQLKLTKFSK